MLRTMVHWTAAPFTHTHGALLSLHRQHPSTLPRRHCARTFLYLPLSCFKSCFSRRFSFSKSGAAGAADALISSTAANAPSLRAELARAWRYVGKKSQARIQLTNNQLNNLVASFVFRILL